MPWKYNGRTIKVGKGWTDDNGFKHPYNWESSWTDQNKTDFGLVWEDAPASEQPFDNTFYWGRQADGTLIERSLTDINEVDDDDNPILDADGNQVVTKGLKTIWIEKTKQTTNQKLQIHDWQITRKYEKSVDIDSDVATYRDAVRTACTTIETAINACSSLSDLQAMFVVPTDDDGTPNGKAPMFNFPDEI
jgi:hypothetical protein